MLWAAFQLEVTPKPNSLYHCTAANKRARVTLSPGPLQKVQQQPHVVVPLALLHGLAPLPQQVQERVDLCWLQLLLAVSDGALDELKCRGAG